MDTAVVVALIAAFASLIATLGKAFWDAGEKRREQRRAEEEARQQRELAEEVEQRRYRSLLLGAANDLGNRLGNIRTHDFFSYLESDRRHIALLTTLFRFGQYFTWAEIYREYLRLNADKVSHLKTDTEAISETLDWIAATFASDLTGPQLMLWREEQSAIADLMRTTGPIPGCIGFSFFASGYDDRYAAWFAKFEDDLMRMFSPPATADSERLAAVQALLARLIVQLDIEKALVTFEDGQVVSPRWAQGGFSNLPDDLPAGLLELRRPVDVNLWVVE
jgi:hypothetical protein